MPVFLAGMLSLFLLLISLHSLLASCRCYYSCHPTTLPAMLFLLLLVQGVLPSLAQTQILWPEATIIEHMKGRSRAYFPLLFRDGGFRVGMEVGVADGRFSELFLTMNNNLPKWYWHMVEVCWLQMRCNDILVVACILQQYLIQGIYVR